MDQFLNFIAWIALGYGSLLAVTRFSIMVILINRLGDTAADRNYNILPHLAVAVAGGAWLYFC
jgi:hypothetical protein